MNKFYLTIVVLFAVIFLSACSKSNNNNQNKPFINLLGPNPINWAQGIPYIDPGAETFDVTESGDTVNISFNLVITDNVNVMQEGSYEVNFNATDTDGNKADEKTRVVKIVLGK